MRVHRNRNRKPRQLRCDLCRIVAGNDHDWRAVRLAMLQTHYRRAADLGATELTAASRAIERLDALFRRATPAGIG